MTAHQRARTASSSHPTNNKSDVANPAGAADSIPPADPHSHPSSPLSPSHEAAPPAASLPASNTISPSIEEAEMLTTLAVPASAAVSNPQAMDIDKDDMDGPADDRSSSLSELGDASDVQSEATPRPMTATDAQDDESEAETERLDITPHKGTRSARETSIASEHVYQRTPSKLVQSRAVDDDDSLPPTPNFAPSESAPEKAEDENSALHALSLASEAASLAELAGKKRKRPSPETNNREEDAGEPARKRNSSAKVLTLNGIREPAANGLEQPDADAELEQAENRISHLAQEEHDLGERQANIAVETVNELATVAKHTKPRKGGRRGKRKLVEESIEAIASIEAEGEGDGDEEGDSGTMDEEVTKKKLAIDELARIEKKFKLFREKLCDEQIAQHELELEMLKQPNCAHPEYLAMIKCIDDRRSDKIAYEKKLLVYKQKNLEIITEAERHQHHSQYFQTVRDERERALAECNQRIFDLQRGRRQVGVDEVEYTLKLPEKRSDQIRQQAAYNLEVSILSGIAKYVGFPAAPDVRPARPSEIDDDLRAMQIVTRPVAPPPPPPVSYVRPTAYGRTSTADEAAAEEQFLERTPWANPQHPAHQQSHYSGPPSSRAQNYHTPIGQRRFDPPNGSASTIEAHSNPPSSGLHPNHHNGGRIAESESPVLHMKRPPPAMDHQHQHHPQHHPHHHQHQLYAESPNSLLSSRNAHHPQHHHQQQQQQHLLSSPAASASMAYTTAVHAEADEQAAAVAARWGAGAGAGGGGGGGGNSMRPGVSPLPPQQPARPMAQRNGIFGR